MDYGMTSVIAFPRFLDNYNEFLWNTEDFDITRCHCPLTLNIRVAARIMASSYTSPYLRSKQAAVSKLDAQWNQYWETHDGSRVDSKDGIPTA